MAELAAKVAVHLDGFTVDPTDPDQRRVGAYLSDGPRRLHLRPAGQPGRVVISGVFPPADHDWRPGRPHITVAIARGPTTVAAEITRRLLPHYTEALARVLDAIAVQQANHAAQRDRAARLAGLLPDARPHRAGRHRTEVRWYGPGAVSGTVDLLYGDGATVNLQLDRVPFELAWRMLERLVQAGAAP